MFWLVSCPLLHPASGSCSVSPHLLLQGAVGRLFQVILKEKKRGLQATGFCPQTLGSSSFTRKPAASGGLCLGQRCQLHWHTLRAGALPQGCSFLLGVPPTPSTDCTEETCL